MTDLWRAFRLLPRRLRWRWVGVIPLLLTMALVEAAGAASVFVLLRALTDFDGVSRMPIASWFPALWQGGPSRRAILTLTAAVMVLYLFRYAVLAAVSVLKDGVARASINELFGTVLEVYLAGPFGMVSALESSVLLKRTQQGVEYTVSNGLGSVVNLVAEGLVALGLLALLAATAPVVTLLAVTLTLALLLLPAVWTQPLFERWGEQEQRTEQQLLQQLQQGLGALREVRVYGREDYFRRRAAAARTALSKVQHFQLLTSDLLRSSVETAFVLVLLIVIAVVTWRGDFADVVPLLGLYAYAGFRFVPSANRMTLNLGIARGAVPFARELCKDIAIIKAPPAASLDADDDMAFERDITFDDVTFTYPPNGVLAGVAGVSLRIPRGSSVGIVGASGAGKSTLVDLLLALLEPTRGRILVDGQDIRRGARSWQRKIGYVAQSFFLIDDTLRRNIAFGVDPDDVDDARVAEAVRVAQLESVVRALPAGLESRVGERGARLSGGERQRVAIARALYGGPEVLVFDEATAALDPQTERDVTEAIALLHGTKTIVVIAHRISTVKDCDQLVMLCEGRVAAVGTFDELLRQSTDFRALVAAGRPGAESGI